MPDTLPLTFRPVCWQRPSRTRSGAYLHENSGARTDDNFWYARLRLAAASSYAKQPSASRFLGRYTR